MILPKSGQAEAIRSRCRQRCEVVANGELNLILRMGTGTQLDIFFARPTERDLLGVKPGNWGSLLLCRTGSREHNIFLCDRARSMGLKWDPYRGLLGPSREGGEPDQVIASETEEEIFRALGLDPVAPVSRER